MVKCGTQIQEMFHICVVILLIVTKNKWNQEGVSCAVMKRERVWGRDRQRQRQKQRQRECCQEGLLHPSASQQDRDAKFGASPVWVVFV